MKKKMYCIESSCPVTVLTIEESQKTCPCCENEIVDKNEHGLEIEEDLQECKAAIEEDIRIYGDWKEDFQSMNHRPTVIYNESGEPLGWD
jgi:hypothetical protein